MACGLTWRVPIKWHSIDRDSQVDMIKSAIRQEMNASYIDARPYKNLLAHLKKSTNQWDHIFVTTNWDYLLQREIDEMGLSVAPHWLPSTQVYHLNGTVEDFGDSNIRSPFLLESDSASMREQRVEANVAFNRLIWQRYFIVIGMSFSCEMDRSFLSAISRVQDDLPIGESSWLIINRSKENVDMVALHIQTALPRAHVSILQLDFNAWVNGPMKELNALGVLNT